MHSYPLAHGHGVHYSAGIMDKMGGGNVGPQQPMLTIQSGPSTGPTIVDMQQHQQPWNVKNANETINPNIPVSIRNLEGKHPVLP